MCILSTTSPWSPRGRTQNSALPQSTADSHRRTVARSSGSRKASGSRHRSNTFPSGARVEKHASAGPPGSERQQLWLCAAGRMAGGNAGVKAPWLAFRHQKARPTESEPPRTYKPWFIGTPAEYWSRGRGFLTEHAHPRVRTVDLGERIIADLVDDSAYRDVIVKG